MDLRPPIQLGKLVQLHDPEDAMRSDTTLLAAALITLGFPRATRDFFHPAREFIRGAWCWRLTWAFLGESRCRRFEADDMVKWWRDSSGSFFLQHPAHPLSILRSALTYARIAGFTPRFSRQQLAAVETPDTWLEAGMRNLVMILAAIPVALPETRSIVRFGAQHAAFVPQCQPEADKTRLLKFVETTDPEKRLQIFRAA